MPPYTLKWMAEAGYVMGLSTIGQVAEHMRCHYDAYWLIETMHEFMAEFDEMVASHEDSSIDLWLTDDDKRQIDEELEAAVAEGPSEGSSRFDEFSEATDETQDEKTQDEEARAHDAAHDPDQPER